MRACLPHYGEDCPAVVAYRISWPDEQLIRGTLGDIRDQVKRARITRTALILVGRALAGDGIDSRLYAADHHHVLRPLAGAHHDRRAPRRPIDRRGNGLAGAHKAAPATRSTTGRGAGFVR